MHVGRGWGGGDDHQIRDKGRLEENGGYFIFVPLYSKSVNINSATITIL